jgi:hypothetical protein
VLKFAGLPSYNNVIPNITKKRASHIILGKCSLKIILEIKATISGYANKIVHANPDGIYVKAPNKNTEDRENIIPKNHNGTR